MDDWREGQNKERKEGRRSKGRDKGRKEVRKKGRKEASDVFENSKREQSWQDFHFA